MGLFQINPNAGLRNEVTSLALQAEGRRLSLDNRGRAYLAARQKLQPRTLAEDNQLRSYYGLDPVQLSGGAASDVRLATNPRGGRTSLVRYTKPVRRRSVTTNPNPQPGFDNPTLDLVNSEARRAKTITNERALAGDLGINIPKTVRYRGQDVTLQPDSNLAIGVRRQLIRRDTPYTNSNGKTVSGVIRPSNINGQQPITQAERVFALANLDQQRGKLRAQSQEHKDTVKKIAALVAVVSRETRNLGANRIDTIPEWMAVVHKIYPNLDLYDPQVQKILQSATTPTGIDTTSAGYREAYRTKEAKTLPLVVVGLDKNGNKIYGRPRAVTPGRLTDTQKAIAAIKLKAIPWQLGIIKGNTIAEVRKNLNQQIAKRAKEAIARGISKQAANLQSWETKIDIDLSLNLSKTDAKKRILANWGDLMKLTGDPNKLIQYIDNHKR